MIDGERQSLLRRMVPLIVVLCAVVPNMVRERHVVAVMVPEWANLIAQLMIVVAICIVIAAVAFGFRAWRSAGSTG